MFNSKKLDGFAKAAHSLKLYRRADLNDDVTDQSLIKKLYVDPLKNDAVLATMLRESTTFLIGRKGTGKSTIFQRAQHDLRSRKNSLSAYIDIKTIYEASEVDPTDPLLLQGASSLPPEETRRLLLYRTFIRAVFKDMKSELKKHVSSSTFNKVLERLNLRRSDITAAIDELLERPIGLENTDITGALSLQLKIDTSGSESKKSSDSKQISLNASHDKISIGASASKNTERSTTQTGATSEQYSSIILRTINITKVIEDLQNLLNSIGIKKLYVFIDDFSELPEEAMHVFVDSILAPLNNWSNELIKFKVAAYPGRIYLGKIDPTKMDDIYLDLYRLYGDRDVTNMEDKASEFTKRLIESRFSHFLNDSFSTFCDKDYDGVIRELFYASMANPRILGHLLSTLRDTTTAYGRLIGIRAVRDAASKYFEDKIEPYFGIQKFALETLNERSSIYSLKELLESIVEKAKSLRDYKDSKVTREITGRTPSSNFYVTSALEAALSTLELNFFITLYYEMKDRDGKKVSIYALNHGLCQKHTISFGRPSGQREHRLYYVERIFDYSSIVKRFLETNQEIKCNECETIYGLDKLEGLKMYSMLCPQCKKGTCIVTNLSKKYAPVLENVDKSLLLPSTELGILEALFTEDREMVASEIAGELDCSYQLVGKRARILADRGLVSRSKNESNRRIYEITDEAKFNYFEENEDRALKLSE